MLDKFGYVWRAPADGKGSYALETEPLAQLGPGRPLGFDFDEDGNLIVCNSGSVSSPADRILPSKGNCYIGQSEFEALMATVAVRVNEDLQGGVLVDNETLLLRQTRALSLYSP